MKKNYLLAVLGLFLIAGSGAAITLEDVAGIYIGKATRTSFDLIEFADGFTTRELQGRRVDAFPDFITPWTP